MKKILSISIIGGFLLTGCKENPIEKLKKTEIPDFPAYTYGQILDNRSLCAKTEWIENEQNNGITEITYRCVLQKPNNKQTEYNEKVSEQVYNEKYEQSLKLLENNKNIEMKALEENIKQIDNSINLINSFLKEKISLLERPLLVDESYFIQTRAHTYYSLSNKNQNLWSNFEKTQSHTVGFKGGNHGAFVSFNTFKTMYAYLSLVITNPDLINELLNENYDSISNILVENDQNKEIDTDFLRQMLGYIKYDLEFCISNEIDQYGYDKNNPKPAEEHCIKSYLDDSKNIYHDLGKFGEKFSTLYYDNLRNELLNLLVEGKEIINTKLLNIEEKQSKPSLEQNAHNQAIFAQNKYERDSVKERIEEIDWIYNKETKKPYLKKAQIYFILGNNQIDMRKFYFQTLVESSTNSSINTIEKYFELRQKEAGKELYNYLYN